MPGRRVTESFPDALIEPLRQMGGDVAAARRARRMTQDELAIRMNIARKTVINIEKGDPRVGFGAYLLAAWVMGLEGKMLEAFRPETDPEFQRQARLSQPRRVRRAPVSDFDDMTF